MKTDALDEIRSWIKKHVQHGRVEAILIVKDGVVVDSHVDASKVIYHLRPTELKEEERPEGIF